MRAIRARKLRGSAYNGHDFRDRQYYPVANRYGKLCGRFVLVPRKDGTVMEVPVVITIEADTFRQTYQHLKRLWNVNHH